MIQITAATREVVADEKELITSGSVGIDVQFIVSEDWDGLEKIAVFRNGEIEDSQIDVALTDSLACKLPPENCAEEYVDEPIFAGIYGAEPETGSIVIPTIWVSLGVLRQGVKPGNAGGADPTPDMWIQLQAIATSANRIAQSVRDDADNGEFDGATFTPAVATDGTLSWTNDQGKENPNPINIRGPQGIQGETGATPAFSIGTVTAREAGTGATAEITGTPEAPVLNLGIPKGDPGEVTEQELAEAVDPIKADLDTKAPVVTKTNGADFYDGADMPMKSLVVNIEPQQDLHGYDAPWAGGNGKNLLDVTQNEEGGISASGAEVEGNTFRRSSNYIPIKASTSYALWANNGWTVRLYWYDANKTFISPRVEGANGGKAIGTSPANAAYARWSIYNANATITESEVLNSQLQLEAGSTATSFQPYSNICPITGVTGLNGSVVGKNWLPNDLTFTDGLRDDTGAQTASAVSHYSEPFLVRPNTLYRATGTIWISGTNPRIYFLDANKNWISRTAQFTQQAFNFTTPTNCCYIQVQCSKDVDLTAGMISLDQSAAVTPYNGNTFSISWETEAGTVYSGTVDPINGTLTVDKKGITFDGSSDEVWNMVAATSRAYIAVPDIITTIPDNSVVDLKSNQYKADAYNQTGITKITGRYNIAQINFFDYQYITDGATINGWLTRLSEHPLQVIYPLATPIVYTLTPTEIRSLLGENHVTVDAGSIESLVYCVDTSAIIERIDADLASLDGRVDTLKEEMDTAQGDITSLETAVEQLDTDIKAVDVKADKKAPAIYSTASGDIASFADGADDMPIRSLVVNIEPVQEGSGDPSPTNIRPITGQTECGVVRTGSNILLPTAPTTVDLTGSGAFRYAQVFPSGTYTIVNGSAIDADIYYRLPTKDLSDRGTSVQISLNGYRTVTVDENHLLWVFRQQNPNMSEYCVNVGTDTAFHAYDGQTVSVSWYSVAGTVYGGTLDIISGLLTVDRVAKRLTVAENLSSAYPGSLIWNSKGTIIRDADEMKPFICNRLKYVGTSVTSSEWKFGTCINANGTSFNLWLKDSAFASLAEATTWLEQNETQICYYLKSPIVHQLSPQQIKTLYAQNHVWTDVGTVDVEYPADTKLYIEQLTKPTEDDMTANANIAANKFFMIGNTLYFSTAAIAQGATIIPGTNCNVISLADALNNLNS